MSDAIRIAREITRAVASVAAICAVALLLLLGVGPHTGRYRTLTVLTGSMDPAIPPGSVVIVTPMSPRDIQVGQVLTYQAPIDDRRIVTHRVVAVRDRGMHPVVITKGDANADVDPWMARIEDPQVWRVQARIPMLGRAIAAARGPLVRTITVWLLPFVLAALWARDLWAREEPQGDEALGPA